MSGGRKQAQPAWRTSARWKGQYVAKIAVVAAALLAGYTTSQPPSVPAVAPPQAPDDADWAYDVAEEVYPVWAGCDPEVAADSAFGVYDDAPGMGGLKRTLH